ncbi:hypothetical protein SAMN05660209_03742 [Geodermatophilus africanus]|uniref:Uncharacterized protein n=1 Tax=Geodermatophilus africanus TaxID=1137993 RepID=A0A1H3MTE4_9ACTN|nr:hypothetical protein SAMN05660209_03742 [Geodermatophilus africanus]
MSPGLLTGWPGRGRNGCRRVSARPRRAGATRPAPSPARSAGGSDRVRRTRRSPRPTTAPAARRRQVAHSGRLRRLSPPVTTEPHPGRQPDRLCAPGRCPARGGGGEGVRVRVRGHGTDGSRGRRHADVPKVMVRVTVWPELPAPSRASAAATEVVVRIVGALQSRPVRSAPCWPVARQNARRSRPCSTPPALDLQRHGGGDRALHRDPTGDVGRASPTSLPPQRIAHPGACGKTLALPQTRRAEAGTCGDDPSRRACGDAGPGAPSSAVGADGLRSEPMT